MHFTLITPTLCDIPGFTDHGHRNLAPLKDSARNLISVAGFGYHPAAFHPLADNIFAVPLWLA